MVPGRNETDDNFRDNFVLFCMGEKNVKMLKDREDKVGLPKLWLFVLLVLGALILGDLNQRMADARRLEQEAEALKEELQTLREEIDRLEKDIEEANTEEFIEEWAHGDAGWVRQGETLVIPVSDHVQEPILGPPEDPDLPVMSNLELWMRLIFGP
jgi:cell division protein FtsB